MWLAGYGRSCSRTIGREVKTRFEDGVTFLAGGQCTPKGFHPEDKESFGPWTKMDPKPVYIRQAPAETVSPRALSQLRRLQKNRYSYDITAVGSLSTDNHPGKMAPEVVFAIRVWDEQSVVEVPNTRFMADKLSWIVSAAVGALDSVQ